MSAPLPDLPAGYTAVGEPLRLGNEFAEVVACLVECHNGSRLLIASPKGGTWIALDPLELEALTWQDERTFSAMMAHPKAPLYEDEQ